MPGMAPAGRPVGGGPGMNSALRVTATRLRRRARRVGTAQSGTAACCPSDKSSGACEPVAATGGGGGRRTDSRVASAAVRAASRLRATIAMGTVTHVASTFVPIRRARTWTRSWTRSVIADVGSTRRVRLPNGCATRASIGGRESRRHEGASTRWSEEPMVRAPGSATSPPPWRAPRWCSMVAACLRPPNLTAPVGNPCSSPGLRIRLANSTSAPAMPSTRHTSSPWPAGCPDRRPRSLLRSPVPRRRWMRSHAQWTRCAASSSASVLLRVVSSVGDSATTLLSSTSASLSRATRSTRHVARSPRAARQSGRRRLIGEIRERVVQATRAECLLFAR